MADPMPKMKVVTRRGRCIEGEEDMDIKNKATAALLAAALSGGAGIGAVVAAPTATYASGTSISDAVDPADRTRGQWVRDSLNGLVDNGTINQQQSDAVAEALREAKPTGGRGSPDHRGHGGHRAGGPAMDEAVTAAA